MSTLSPEILDQFDAWMSDAAAQEPNDPNAMSLATVGADGMPSARIVLLKGLDADGPQFFTNYESRKARELDAHPQASLLFHWKTLRRQVRFEGTVEKLSAAESDSYFATRPRGSQIGAWASAQSAELASRDALEQRVADYTRQFDGQPVPRPPHWGGYRLRVSAVEFWQDQPSRLHDRRLWRIAGGEWQSVRLNP